MSERQFAEIIARALVMVLRAMNARYGLRIWFLTRHEREKIRSEYPEIAKVFDMD